MVRTNTLKSGLLKNVEAQLKKESASDDSVIREMESLKSVLRRLGEVETKIEDAGAFINSLKSKSDLLEVQLKKLDTIETKLDEERVRSETMAESIALIKEEIFSITNYFGPRFERFIGRIVSWRNYHDAYQIWNLYKQGHVSRDDAFGVIGHKYGVRSFFVLLPFFKILKFFKRFKIKIPWRAWVRDNAVLPPVEFDQEWYSIHYPDVSASGIDPLQHYIKFGRAEGRLGCPPKIDVNGGRAFDSSKKAVLLISHDASQTGAPILAFNLLEKLAERFNVISVLLGPGILENAFRNVSCAILGPFPERMRYTDSLHGPLLDTCRTFEPAFAIVNSLESREVLVPLARAKVPSVLLVHEFASLYPQLDMRTVVLNAGQLVFPAKRVFEDAADVFPWLTAHAANIVTQGQSRIPREWLSGDTADDEEKRIAAVMRPDGPDDDAIVVIGCGYFDVRKGIDLFLSVAASLQQRSPSRRFRFVWVGKASEDLYASYLATHVKCCGLQDMVKFLGEVNSLDPVYAMADIFLLSSRLDPFPNVAIDAMLAGLPLVCFRNASGVAEMLESQADLKHLVVPYADAASAASVIEQLSQAESRTRETGIAISKLAISCFNMDRYVRDLESMAEEAAFIMAQKEQDFETISRSDLFLEEHAVQPHLEIPKSQCLRYFIDESAGFGGIRCPFPGFNPAIYRNEHPELNEPPYMNPLAHFIRCGEPDGPWLLNTISPAHSQPNPPESSVALHLHIHYPDLTTELLGKITANKARPDLFITVSSKEGLEEVSRTAAKFYLNIKEIMIVPNRGRDIGPLITLFGNRMVRNYEIIGHLHAKRSACLPEPFGQSWREFCLENLLGKQHPMMDIILAEFGREEQLGLVFPSDPNIHGWTLNRPIANDLLQRMGISIELANEFFFPVGTMFWARTDAIAPLLELGCGWNDYPAEPLPYDGTILHAIERLFPFVAQQRGFGIAGTFVPGVTR